MMRQSYDLKANGLAILNTPRHLAHNDSSIDDNRGSTYDLKTSRVFDTSPDPLK